MTERAFWITLNNGKTWIPVDEEQYVALERLSGFGGDGAPGAAGFNAPGRMIAGRIHTPLGAVVQVPIIHTYTE